MRSCVDQVLKSTDRWCEPDSWEAYESQGLLADTYRMAGDFRDASNLYEPLCDRNTQTSLLSNGDMRYLLQRLAAAHQGLGNNERAVEVLVEELRISEMIYSIPHPELLASLERLAESYVAVGAARKAVTLLEHVVKCETKHISREYWWLGLMSTLAQAYDQLDQYDQAVPLLEEMHAHWSKTLLANDPVRNVTMNRLAHAYLKIGEPIQVVKLLEEVVKIDASSLPRDDPNRLSAMERLAEAYLNLDMPSQAIPLFEGVMEFGRSDLPMNDGKRSYTVDRLASAYLKTGKPGQAATLLEEVLECFPAHDSGRSISIDRLAEAYLRLDKADQAVTLLEEVVEIDASSLPANHPGRLTTVARLAETYIRLGRSNQAVPFLEELVALDASNLAEEDKSRLMSRRKLAQAYTELEDSQKAGDAISILQDVMDKGRETLHADPKELEWTQKILAHAQEKLRKTSQQQSIMISKEEQGILADRPPASMVYRHIRDFTRKAALMF
jgi:tetratricopeptide (TPR) repeat protein